MGFLSVNATEFDGAVADLETRLTERGATMLPILKNPELKERFLHGWYWFFRDMMRPQVHYDASSPRMSSIQMYASMCMWLCTQRRNASFTPSLYALKEALDDHMKYGGTHLVGTEPDPEYKDNLKDYTDLQRLRDEESRFHSNTDWSTYELVRCNGCTTCEGSGIVRTYDRKGCLDWQDDNVHDSQCPSCHGSPKPVTKEQQAVFDALLKEHNRFNELLAQHRPWTSPPSSVREVYLLMP